jgi:hypothetical protein
MTKTVEPKVRCRDWTKTCPRCPHSYPHRKRGYCLTPEPCKIIGRDTGCKPIKGKRLKVAIEEIRQALGMQADDDDIVAEIKYLQELP